MVETGIVTVFRLVYRLDLIGVCGCFVQSVVQFCKALIVKVVSNAMQGE
jgi:hypothetical protein